MLGAEVTKRPGVRSVTTRHVALAAAALETLEPLLAHVDARLRAVLRGERVLLLSALAAVRRDYASHRSHLAAKLLAILDDRVALYCAEALPPPGMPPLLSSSSVSLATVVPSTPSSISTAAASTTTITSAAATTTTVATTTSANVATLSMAVSDAMHRLINDVTTFHRVLARVCDDEALQRTLTAAWTHVTTRLRAACTVAPSFVSVVAADLDGLSSDERLQLQRARTDQQRRHDQQQFVVRRDCLIFVDFLLRLYQRDTALPPALLDFKNFLLTSFDLSLKKQ